MKSIKWTLWIVCVILVSPHEIKAQKRAKSEFVKNHQVSLSWGWNPLLENIATDDSIFGPSCYDTSFREEGLSQYMNMYKDKLLTTHSISVGYAYNPKRMLAFGALFSYQGFSQKRRDIFTDKVVERSTINQIQFTPFVRGIWLNRPKVQLYSQFGFGFSIECERDKEVDHSGYGGYSDSRTIANVQFTPIGVSFGGDNIFGFAELGVGTLYTVRAGIGYKFNKKNQL